MTKTEIVAAKKAELAVLSTEDLAIKINAYFYKHATMPGEKDLKKAAEKIVANIVENPEFDMDQDAKDAMIEAFADITVREMKVEGLQVKNVNKENKDDASVLKPTDLGLVETGSTESDGKKPATKTYEANARIKDGSVFVGEYRIGSLGKGFVANNPGVSVPATLVATDYSNGQFKNMSYTVIADISREEEVASAA